MNVSTAPDSTASAKKIAESIAALPPLPATAQEILTCFGDEFIDADKVSAVVEGDPGICAKLLGLANSAYFGLAEPVNTISEAISRVLGVDTVRSLVLAMAIQQSFNSRDCPAFNVEQFWVQSLQTAECCKKVAYAAELADDTVRDLAYSAGLCHNLGLMALAHIEPERTNAVLRAHADSEGSDDLRKLFLEELDTDHRIMTSELARIWSLPELMVGAFQNRAFPDATCSELLPLILAAAAVAVGNTLLDDDQHQNLGEWDAAIGVAAVDLQKMAVLGEKQQERVRSLASNMS